MRKVVKNTKKVLSSEVSRYRLYGVATSVSRGMVIETNNLFSILYRQLDGVTCSFTYSDQVPPSSYNRIKSNENLSELINDCLNVGHSVYEFNSTFSLLQWMANIDLPQSLPAPVPIEVIQKNIHEVQISHISIELDYAVAKGERTGLISRNTFATGNYVVHSTKESYTNGNSWLITPTNDLRKLVEELINDGCTVYEFPTTKELFSWVNTRLDLNKKQI